MTLAYADSQKADDTGDGLTWATAKLTKQAVMDVAGAGGIAFFQDSVSGGFTESTASSVTYTSPGTKDNPTVLVACKSGTTNEPPVTADLILDRDDADLAFVEVTGAANDITLAGYADVWGFEFNNATSGDDILPSLNNVWYLHHCIFHPGDDFRMSTTGAFELIEGCEVVLDPGSGLAGSGILNIKGGEITGTTTRLMDNSDVGLTLTLSGVDLSSISSIAGVDIGISIIDIRLMNCKIPASYVLVEGTWLSTASRVTMIGCDNSSDHTASIRQYRSENGQGFIVDDTPFISGGAQDRDSGDGYSFSINLNNNTVLERFSPLYTEWLEVPLDGTETTLTIEVMRKDTGAPADLDNETCWVELQSPNEGVGSATSQYASQSSKPSDPLVAAAALTSSSATWSNLGGQTAKKQKIVFTISPEYAGVARYRVAYAERGTSILPLYFDPFPTLA